MSSRGGVCMDVSDEEWSVSEEGLSVHGCEW